MTWTLFRGYAQVLKETAFALLPLLIIFIISQFTVIKMKKRQFVRILIGVLLSYIGLTLFLQGVNVGYIRAGSALGGVLASLSYNWILVPIGFFLGFAVTLAEPSIYVLVQEIDKVTSGFIPRRTMIVTLCIGVALAIALAMLKILLHLSLWAFIVPGYILALILAYMVSSSFTSIAFDSGGVATGTMTATFLLSLSIGAANQMEHTDPLLDGFGIIALVALVPTLTVLGLGLIYKHQEKKMNAPKIEKADESTEVFEEDGPVSAMMPPNLENDIDVINKTMLKEEKNEG